ncbi:MAG: copper resistance protein CopC, partial [Acidimicrobiia bacterium]
MNRSGGLRALLVGLVVAVVVVVALPAPPASAHAALVETVPAAETAVDEAPDAIVLRFNEAVSTSLGGVKVFAAGGDDVDVGKPTTSGDGTTVTASLPALDDGAYAVSWRVVSADAHPIKGAFTFVVGDGAGGAAAKADLAERLSESVGGATRMVGVAFGAARLAVFAGLVVLVGGIAFLWLLWPAGLGALGCRRLLGGAWLAAFTATIAGIALQGAYASAGTLADAFKPSLFADVLSTRFGTVWALRAGLLLLALAFVIPLGRERARAPSGPLRLGGALLGGALLLTPGLSGHASTGQWRIASLVSDVTHLGAVALWLGGLTVLAAVLLPRRDARTTTEVVPRFSRLAFAAVVIIVVTGTFQSWRQVRFADALTDTTFGRLLLVKVAVFVGLVGVAAFSRRLLHARLRIPSPARPRLA